jgi:phage tail-like protein
MTPPDSLIDGPTQVSLSRPGARSSAPASKGRSSSATTSEPLASSYLFYVKIDGSIVGVFTDCSGIGAKRLVESFREGGVNDSPHLLPGPLEYNNITLKRGITTSHELWDWFLEGKFDIKARRTNLTIIQSAAGDQGIVAIKVWDVKNAFPVSWKLSDLNTGSSTMAIETIELAHEGLSLQP